MGDSDLGRTSVLRHKIDTGDAAPIHQTACRLPFHLRELVHNMIEGMLDQGIVEPAEGAWSSPIVLAKKDGSYRFCVDFCRVNDVTKKDVHPIPRIDDALDSLAGTKLFSVLDLASGYWQVELDPADKEKTAFATPFGLHQFRVMPFGLTNAPSTFQRLMSLVLSGLCWKMCLVYLDDIIIFSQTVEEHLQRLAEVLRRLKDVGLKASANFYPKVCNIWGTLCQRKAWRQILPRLVVFVTGLCPTVERAYVVYWDLFPTTGSLFRTFPKLLHPCLP